MSEQRPQRPFNLLDVSGRASRTEFGVVLALWLVVVVAFSTFARTGIQAATLFGLVSSLPMLLSGVRRLHDRGQSGWWLLITLVPIINLIFLVMLARGAPEPGPNRYGPPVELGPKEA